MTHTPVLLSPRSSGLRRGAALAILPLLLASCGSSTSTASNIPCPRTRPWLHPRQQQAPPGPLPLPQRRRNLPPALNLTKPRKLKPSSSRKPSAQTAEQHSPPTSLRGMLCATRQTSPPAPKLNQREPSAWHCTRRTRPITPTLRHGYALSMTITWQAER